ncbi:MAG TPA: hypothetical protein VN066_03135, partial [Rhodocyclaceae bacterium]|nr:hypothetical protein [Rhodocyclaceae bacterium]
MAEMHERQTETGIVGDEDQLRQTLLRRIGLAGVVIVALVASLAMFDAVFVNAPTHETPDAASVPVSAAPATPEPSPAVEEKAAEPEP